MKKLIFIFMFILISFNNSYANEATQQKAAKEKYVVNKYNVLR